MLPPARRLSFVSTGSNQLLLNGASILTGWALCETTSSAGATLNIFDGQDTSASGYATLIGQVTLTSGQSTRDLWAPSGIEIDQAITITAASGSVRGALFAIPGEIYDAFMLTQGYRPVWSSGS